MRSIFTLLAVGFMAVSTLAAPVKQPSSVSGVIASNYQHMIDGQGGYLSAHLYTDVLIKNGIDKATAKKAYKLSSHYISQYKRTIEKGLAAQIKADVLSHYKKPFEKHINSILSHTTALIKVDLAKGLPHLQHELIEVFKQFNLTTPLITALVTFIDDYKTKQIKHFCEDCTPSHFKHIVAEIKAAEK